LSCRAIRTEQRHDLPIGHFQGHALEHQNHVVVDDLDIVYRQERCARKVIFLVVGVAPLRMRGFVY
jgi:hypothetical protein